MRTTRTVIGAMVIATAMAAVGCGADGAPAAGAAAVPPSSGEKVTADGSASSPEASKAGAALRLSLDEYSVSPYIASVRVRTVRITATNRGDRTHELIVARSVGRVPTRKGRADEAAMERKGLIVGEIADIAAGGAGTKTFTLARGTYILFCNLPGHYGAGMRATLVVRRGG